MNSVSPVMPSRATALGVRNNCFCEPLKFGGGGGGGCSLLQQKPTDTPIIGTEEKCFPLHHTKKKLMDFHTRFSMGYFIFYNTC